MKRSYNFSSEQKTNKDDKIVTFCAIAIVVIASMTYMYCSSLDVNKTGYAQDTTESVSDMLAIETEVSDEELESGLDETSKQYGMTREEFEKQIGSKELFKYDLLMKKAMKVVTE